MFKLMIRKPAIILFLCLLISCASGDRVKSFAGANLAGKSMAGEDLSRADLRGANLRGADLRGVNLMYANLAGADFTDADLRSTMLYGAIFQENRTGTGPATVCLQGADLKDAIVEKKWTVFLKGQKVRSFENIVWVD